MLGLTASTGTKPRRTFAFMLICHCKRVSHVAIEAAVLSGARTVGQVGRVNGAGTCCGGCVPAVAAIVEARRPLRTIQASELESDVIAAE